MDTLYDMRRTAKDAHAGKADKIDESNEDNTVFKAVVASTTDTESEVHATIKALQEGGQLAADLGGARHPTALATQRALVVARRKVQLLHDIETRMAAFKVANKRRSAILIDVAYQDGDPPPEMLDIAQFCDARTHHPANPVEDHGMLSNFDNFCETFLLPARHKQLQALRELGVDMGNWWADKLLDLANKGGDKNSRKARLAKLNGEAIDESYRLTHGQLKKLARVVFTSGLDQTGPKMIELRSTLSDRMAEAVLAEAQEFQKDDATMADSVELAPVGPAARAAGKLESMISETLSDGCPDCHPKLEQVRLIVKALYQADIDRKQMQKTKRYNS
jgi:hypothetical protein